MSKPKRHHWWPMVQSQHWTNSEGVMYATRADGTYFRPSPLNIGLESELYTRFGENDTKDTSIESWFSEAIDSPATVMIKYLLDGANVRRRAFKGDPRKAEMCRAVGFRVNSYIDFVPLPDDIRDAIASYLAALLVRHPDYLEKLRSFHELEGSPNSKGSALDNMLHLFGVYRRVIRDSVMMLSKRTGDAEYLYADGGLMVTEPWRRVHGIPFDIHAPLTPDLAIEILPSPLKDDKSAATISESTNQGIARQNRIILGGAKRFVFSRSAPPVAFIRRYFGVPAPTNIGYRIVNGKLETRFEPTKI